MSIHIDDPAHVTALLISGQWIGVDPGSLHRHEPPRGSSGTTELVYEWTHGGSQYLALASEVSAVQVRAADA